MTSLPPRSAALPSRMLLAFDLDCGELVPGHRFVARGLADQDELRAADFGIEGDAAVAGFSLEYELVPGVAEGARSFFDYLVAIAYEADVALPWEPADCGAIAPFVGGPSTHGSRGDWPLPAGARHLSFTLCPVGADGLDENPAGEIAVDLAEGTAVWRPAE